MQLLLPYLITAANLLSSSIAENEYPLIVNGQSYSIGARVILDHWVYESLTSSVSSWVYPLDPTQWASVGPTNRHAAFDDAVGTYSTATSSLSFTVGPLGIVDSVVLFGVTGSSVSITLPDASRVVSVPAPASSGGSVVVVQGLNSLGGNLQLTLTGTGTVKLGNVCIGTFSDVGVTDWGLSVGMVDFTKKDPNEFGDVSISERDFALEMEVPFTVATSDADRVFNTYAAVRSTPVAWVGVPGFSSSVIYGFHSDVELEVDTVLTSGSVRIQGLASAGISG